MLDTIQYRFYGLLDTKDHTHDEVKVANGLADPYAVPEHNSLYLAMIRSKERNKSMRVVFNQETAILDTTDENEFIRQSNAKGKNAHWQSRMRTRIIEEGEVKEQNMRINGRYRVPSSFSDVTFKISESGSYMDIQVSIPKYMFGHSLAEFVPQAGSKFRMNTGSHLDSFSFQKKHLYERFRNFTSIFFADLCRTYGCDVLPDERYIEIRRFDLCYNQQFETKEDALLYLQEQKKLDLVRQRVDAKTISKVQEYVTSISYHTSAGAYFKIYHKGSEYSSSEHGDLKKHIEINKEFIDKMMRDKNGELPELYKVNYDKIWRVFKCKGEGIKSNLSKHDKNVLKGLITEIYKHVPYNTDYLKNQMDKVLRYEISFQGQGITDLYKRKVFRKAYSDLKIAGCPHHKSAFQTYKLTKNQLDSRTNKDPLGHMERRLYKKFDKWLHKRVALTLNDSPRLKRHERTGEYDAGVRISKEYEVSKFPYRYTTLGNKEVGRFSEEFLLRAWEKFEAMIDYYQVKKVRPFEDIIDRITAYNKEALLNRKKYNAENQLKCFNLSGERKRKKSGAEIMFATDLLKQSKLRSEKLKTVNKNLLGTYLTHMEQGKSLDEIFTLLKTSPSTKSRIKQDLAMFGVYSQTLATEKDIVAEKSFRKYYFITSSLLIRNKFFTSESHYRYGQFKAKTRSLQSA